MAKKSVAKRSAAKDAAGEAEKPARTTSANKALSVKDTVGARAAAVATNRWATLKETDGIFDKDPRKEVINISIMENGPPEVDGSLAAEGNENAEKYTYQQVGPGVMIGMREGGEFESVDGFGWRDAEDKAAHGNPAGQGAARLADMQ
ncbi:hypothetical protein [Bradyrhizobium japonicum]|uniref:hypothetical protein n=1 Tax=Bradyrhizobium japonicum TaxID=375 RepID=UPI00040DE7E9|nr:hypothetical protein [Bradyrhizobium japonicum]